MISVRKSDDRGQTRIGWLDSRHSFSFNRYYDPRHMGFRTLRVINDDDIAPGGAFGTHPHQDMEILTWVLDGSVVHRDSTGGSGEIRPGDLQAMTAGTGIFHSEANGSKEKPLRLLQIWIHPEGEGLKPGYDQKHFPKEQRTNRLQLVASRDERDASLLIHQDASVYVADLEPGNAVTHTLAPGRGAWLQVATGSVTLNGVALEEGDGAAVTEESVLEIAGRDAAEVLLFDLA